MAVREVVGAAHLHQPAGGARELEGAVARRIELLGLGVGADYRFSRFVLRALAQADLGLTRANYDGPYGRTQRHASGSLGGVLELQTRMLSWLSAYAALGAAGTFARAEYQVSGQPVAREAAWWGRATLGLMGVFSPR